MYAHYELLEMMQNKLAYSFSVCLCLTFMSLFYQHLIITKSLIVKNLYTTDFLFFRKCNVKPYNCGIQHLS